MATTRRDFLKQSASIAGMLPVAALAGEGLCEAVGEQAPEALFAGRPLSYWVARVTRPVDEPEFEDVFTQDALTYFGDEAVPHRNRSRVGSLENKGFLNHASLGGAENVSATPSAQNLYTDSTHNPRE